MISRVFEIMYWHIQDLRSCPISIASSLLAVCIKVLFPEPVTPITAMKTSGIVPETMTMTRRDLSGFLSCPRTTELEAARGDKFITW